MKHNLQLGRLLPSDMDTENEQFHADLAVKAYSDACDLITVTKSHCSTLKIDSSA